MKLKRLLALALATLFCLALLAACGGGATPDPNNTAAPGDGDTDTEDDRTPAPTVYIPEDTYAGGMPDEIVGAGKFEPVPNDTVGELLIWMDNDAVFEKINAAWQEVYPNIKLEYENVGNTVSRRKISLDGPAGIGADVFFMPHDHITNGIQDGTIEALDGDLQNTFRELIDPAALSVVTVENHETKVKEMFAVPSTRENIALYYNKVLWGPEPPKTMDEVFARADEFNDPFANTWTLGWNVGDPYKNYHWLTAFGFKIFGPDMNDYKNIGFDSPEAGQGIEYFINLRDKVLDLPSAEADEAKMWVSFLDGLIPLMITGPWKIPEGIAKRDEAGAENFDFGIAPLPTIDGNIPYPYYGSIIACISSYTEVPDLAKTFVYWYCGLDGAPAMYDARGALSALKDDLLGEIPGVLEDELLMGMLEQNKYTHPMPTILEIAQMWGPAGNMHTFAWNRELDAAGAQDRVMKDFRDALEVAGRDTSWFDD